ncbi:hypothetical protein BC830DRAFT_1089483 [Chytriomyces sp. MP71]|nr:hypothetical protein BC830DRAFT_1089483 [Chytriomyces sp. MP71]
MPDMIRDRSSEFHACCKGGVGGNKDSSVIDLGMGGQQQLMMQSNNATTMEYIESRGQAIDTIESTNAELRQISSQFTQILD